MSHEKYDERNISVQNIVIPPETLSEHCIV